jgi:light-regulated signal transduction histidine kinase (bacteriophytochrome)/CheY-like chemotaxis protein
MRTKILIVDDREDNLFSIETILGNDDYVFVKANSGTKALKILLTEFDFALILMDVKMPNLDGFETAALIYEREKLKHIPIIFITANSYGDENVFKGYRTGAVDYIYKPINPALLKAKVAVFVDLYKKNHRLLAQERKLITINKNLADEVRERKASEEKVKELNYQLLENIARLESTNKELDRVVFMASHDLQEPLRKMMIFSDRLFMKYEKLLDADGKRDISRIQAEAVRMRKLIEDILTFSKMTVENKSLEQSDMNVLLQEVLAGMDEDIVQKNAKLIVEELPSLYVNPGLIRPLFFNLLSNALKYSRPDIAPVITIRAQLNIEEEAGKGAMNKYCRIFVEDNGIGFEQQYSEQIFGMFKRLHDKNKYEGTGIGLAICKKIVEEHNGFISVISKVNEGSTFIVSLPVLNPADN